MSSGSSGSEGKKLTKKSGSEIQPEPSSVNTSPDTAALHADLNGLDAAEEKLVNKLNSFNEYAEAMSNLQRLMGDGFLNLMLCRR